ncbi:MAG: ribonuclease domain-containing protein [Burkholderiaceae bacterium]
MRSAARIWRGVLAALLAAALMLAAPGAAARDEFARVEGIGVIRVAALPAEGRQVLAAIHAGGPYGFRRDGIVFGNRESLLPRRSRGYYAEFTVPTPGSATRGARRIIAGRGSNGDYRTSNEYYYTNDHYQSFRRIEQ